jgi:hypothetical protein
MARRRMSQMERMDRAQDRRDQKQREEARKAMRENEARRQATLKAVAACGSADAYFAREGGR